VRKYEFGNTLAGSRDINVKFRSQLGPGQVLFDYWLGPFLVISISLLGPFPIPLKFLVSLLQRFIKPFAIGSIHNVFGSI
jgi:hypothetical protein